MPLGTEVNLGPGDIISDGVAAPSRKGAQLAVFGPRLCGQTAGWMKTPPGMEVDLGPGHIVLDGDPAPPAKGAQQSPLFFGSCILWPWLPISATAELLFICFEKNV